MKKPSCSAVTTWMKDHGTDIVSWAGVVIAFVLSVWFSNVLGERDLSSHGRWILGATFAATFFSVNFAFIGFNLSPYSKLWRRLSLRHWGLIILLLVIPLFPVATLLVKPEKIWNAAVAVAPFVTLLSLFAYRTSADLLDPRRVIKQEYSPKAIAHYRTSLRSAIDLDSSKQKSSTLLPASERPMHMWDYRPYVIEAKSEPLWDRLMIIVSVALDAHDYEVFEIAFDKAFMIYKALLQAEDGMEGRSAEGLEYVAERRFKSLIALIGKSGSDRIFMEVVNSRLCAELTSPDCLRGFKEKFPMSLMGMLEEICAQSLLNKKEYDALKALNAVHTFTSVAAAEARKDKSDYLATFGVAGPIWIIKRIGSHSVVGGDVEMLYRCLESLAWLGCGMAAHSALKGHQEHEPLKACILSLVQLGREARNKKLQCFWDRCILPPHIHAEEKLGWILKLLVQIPPTGEGEKFIFEDTITTAYCRLRGFDCHIEHNPRSNPKFWIRDDEDEYGNKIPHQISMKGAEGYDWIIDYSDEAELKEYALH